MGTLHTAEEELLHRERHRFTTLRSTLPNTLARKVSMITLATLLLLLVIVWLCVTFCAANKCGHRNCYEPECGHKTDHETTD